MGGNLRGPSAAPVRLSFEGHALPPAPKVCGAVGAWLAERHPPLPAEWALLHGVSVAVVHPGAVALGADHVTTGIFHGGRLRIIRRGDEADGALLGIGEGEELEHPCVVHVARHAECAPAVEEAQGVLVPTQDEVRTGLRLTRGGIGAADADIGICQHLIPVKSLAVLVFFSIFRVCFIAFFLAFFRASILLQAHSITWMWGGSHVCENQTQIWI